MIQISPENGFRPRRLDDIRDFLCGDTDAETRARLGKELDDPASNLRLMIEEVGRTSDQLLHLSAEGEQLDEACS
jgi:uncharacterized phage protein gp47/JayE